MILYKIITLPYEHIECSENVQLGINKNPKKSISEDKILIKTTQELIDQELAKGTTLEQIFPSDKTTDYTLEALEVELLKEEWAGPDNWKGEF